MFSSILNILFPAICNGCERMLSSKEKILCTSCRHQIPLASYHTNNAETLKNIFYGRIAVENATALLTFQKKGITQKLLHNLKYKKQEEISDFLGAWLGAELKDVSAYKKIDIVIPVPLHRNKLRTRGYNQVAGFGKALANALQKPYVDDVLLKVSRTESQVFKGRGKRIQDTQIFTLKNPEKVANKHILLVDDIVTTGATLENCALQLCENTNAKISIATMAISL